MIVLMSKLEAREIAVIHRFFVVFFIAPVLPIILMKVFVGILVPLLPALCTYRYLVPRWKEFTGTQGGTWYQYQPEGVSVPGTRLPIM